MPARARILPGDIHPDAAARRMGMTRPEFERVLPRLLSRGFPIADPDTGMFDLDAIDRWRHRRNPHLFPDEPQLTTASLVPNDASGVVKARLAEARRGHG